MADAKPIPPTGDADARQQADSSLGKHISDPSPSAGGSGASGRGAYQPVDGLAVAESGMRATQRQLATTTATGTLIFMISRRDMLLLDEDGYIQEVNLAGAKLLGMDRNTLTGYPFVDYVAKDDIPAFLDHVRQCIAVPLRGDFRGGPGDARRGLADGVLPQHPHRGHAAPDHPLQDGDCRHHRQPAN